MDRVHYTNREHRYHNNEYFRSKSLWLEWRSSIELSNRSYSWDCKNSFNRYWLNLPRNSTGEWAIPFHCKCYFYESVPGYNRMKKVLNDKLFLKNFLITTRVDMTEYSTFFIDLQEDLNQALYFILIRFASAQISDYRSFICWRVSYGFKRIFSNDSYLISQ